MSKEQINIIYKNPIKIKRIITDTRLFIAESLVIIKPLKNEKRSWVATNCKYRYPFVL